MKEYPLEHLLDVKKKRVNEALLVVKEKQEIFDKEERALKKLQEEEKKAGKLYAEKLEGVRNALDAGENTVKLRALRDHLKLVKDTWLQVVKQVKDQQKILDTARAQLEIAIRHLKEKRKDVEKIDMHKDHWKKEEKAEIMRQEGHEQDELGTVGHTFHKKKKRR